MTGFTTGRTALLFFIFAFMGWLLEVAYAFYVHRRFVNRGFLKGPLCPVYGVGMTGMVLIASYLKNRLDGLPLPYGLGAVFLSAFVFTSIVEYITGFLLESIFHQRWWDYTDRKFNLKGRICLRFSLYWGGLGLVIIELVNLLPYHPVNLLSERQVDFALHILIPVFLIDFATSVDLAMKLEGLLREMHETSERLREKFEENALEVLSDFNASRTEKLGILTELADNIRNGRKQKLEALSGKLHLNARETSDLIEDLKKRLEKWTASREREVFQKGFILNQQSRRYDRLIKAFPGLKSARYNDALREIKKRLGKNDKPSN